MIIPYMNDKQIFNKIQLFEYNHVFAKSNKQSKNNNNN